MATNEETNAAGTDTRPPMLVENDTESWKISYTQYIRGQTQWQLNGIHPEWTRHLTRWSRTSLLLILLLAPHLGRKLTLSSIQDKQARNADTKLKSSSSVFPDTSSTSPSNKHCKEEFGIMWKMLMQGSGRTLQQRKEDLFDEYERFRAIGNESIHDYFVRFHKLVNDMKITQLEIPYISDEH
ncbi:hypothetical protein Tco_0201665 [Tanacetum coccineum]